MKTRTKLLIAVVLGTAPLAAFAGSEGAPGGVILYGGGVAAALLAWLRPWR